MAAEIVNCPMRFLKKSEHATKDQIATCTKESVLHVLKNGFRKPHKATLLCFTSAAAFLFLFLQALINKIDKRLLKHKYFAW